MRVKMLIGRNAGQIEEVPFHVGETLVMGGQAERVDDSGDNVETATKEVPEQAVSRGAKRKK